MWTCVLLTQRGFQAWWDLLYCPGGNASASVWPHLTLWGPALGSPSASSTCPWPLTRAARWPAHTHTQTYKMPWREAYSDCHGVASSLDGCFFFLEMYSMISTKHCGYVVYETNTLWTEICALKILADFLVICSKLKSSLWCKAWPIKNSRILDSHIMSKLQSYSCENTENKSGLKMS